jgi:hypothetical protein
MNDRGPFVVRAIDTYHFGGTQRFEERVCGGKSVFGNSLGIKAGRNLEFIEQAM